jgi:hypothetical protein
VYITIAVLMSKEIEEPEAKEFDLEPATRRDARMVEEELERLLAPHSGSTMLVVRNVRDGAWEKRVPNYGASFDFWDLDESLLGHFWERFIALSVEDRIYPDLYTDDEDEAPKGHPVFRASELPLDLPYDGIVTPDGRYHDFWTGENKDNRELAGRLIREHGECLAVLCSAHV